MVLLDIPSARAFQAIRSVSVSELSSLKDEDLRPLLPCLVRMALCSPVDESAKWTEARKEVQKLLSGLEVVNSIVALLSVDFSLLEQDALKEQQLRRKVGGCSVTSSVLVESLQNGLALEFERSEPSRRLRLVLSELLRIMSQVDVREEFIPEKCELFESEVYLEEVSDVICIAQAELPSLLARNQLAEALLRVKHGPWLLCQLVANAPDSFEQVCTSLLEHGEVQDEGGLGEMVRTQALRQLCAMNPSSALVVHSEALRLCHMPGLAVALILDFGVDSTGSLVAFLSGLLLGGDTKARNWFSSFVRIGQKSNTSILSSLRRQLLKEMSSLVPNGAKKGINSQDSKAGIEVTIQHTVPEQDVSHQDEETLEILQAMEVSTDYELTEESSSTSQINMEIFETVEIRDEDVIQGTALLRLYCALKRLAGMKLTQQESEALLRLVTCHPPPTAAGVRFVVVGLCTLLVCTNIMSSPEHEQIATQWINWLSKEEAHYEAASGVHASFGEILLMIAIHFHASQVEAIADLVCSVLGMNIRLGSLTRMKTLFTQEIFPEKVVTAHAVTVPVTPQLSSDDAGFLPIHCVHQLLRSRAFTKHAVPVKDWVYKQICCCTTPLHPLVVPLLEAFVHSVINPASKSGKNKEAAFTLHGFTDVEVMSVFAADQQEEGTFRIHGLSLGPMRRSSVYVGTEMSSRLTSQILMLYYVLTYQDCLLSNMKSLVSNNIQPQWLSPMLLSQIPIKHLLEQARSRRQEFRGLYAPLLQLINTHLPHLCLVDDWLRQEEVFTVAPDMSASSPLPNVHCSPSRLQEALHLLPDNPCPALLLLTRLLQLEPSSLIAYMDVLVQALTRLLEPGVPRRVQTLCCELWTKINTVVPRKLWLATVNTLCPAETPVPHLTPQLYTDEDIMKDPLTVLRCDRRVFRCPPLFDLLVRILMGYLAGSRALLSQYLQAHPASRTEGIAVEQEREELRAALVTAQESAAIQILLEVCVKTPQDQDQPGCSGSGVLREIQCCVCSQLHQMFIAVPDIAKLVHFQGYPVELLPVTVAGIPSMHICLDFIPELVNQPQLEKQLFAIQLASYLCLQFPLPKAMGVARYIVSRLSSLLATLPASKRAPFFTPTLPTLVRFCRAFPPLCDEATGFLLELGRVAASHASASACFTLGTPGSLLHQLSSKQQQDSTSDQEDHGFTDDSWLPNDFKLEDEKSVLDSQVDITDVGLCQAIEKVFLDLTKVAVVRQQNCQS